MTYTPPDGYPTGQSMQPPVPSEGQAPQYGQSDAYSGNYGYGSQTPSDPYASSVPSASNAAVAANPYSAAAYPSSSYPGYGTPAGGGYPVLPSTPGSITTARVFAWIQVGFAFLGAVLFAIIAAVVGTASTDSDVSGVKDLAAGVIVIIVVFILIVAAGIMVPLILMKRGRSAPVIVLTVVECILLLLTIVGVANSSNSNPVGSLIGLGICLAVLIGLWMPGSRAWWSGNSQPQPTSVGYSAQAGQSYQVSQSYQTGQPYQAAQSHAAQPVAAQAGQWAADPSGRHQYRWYDGSRWTQNVSDNGAMSVDPTPIP